MKQPLDFADAVRIVEKAMKPNGLNVLSVADAMCLHEAQALLAAEYVRVRTRIMPA